MSTSIPIPVLDPRDEDALTAEVVDALPVEITDRSASAPTTKMIEALGAYYGATLYYLNQWPELLRARLLALLGYAPAEAVAATATLRFTASSLGATVPAGTIVKTGSGADAIKFATTAELLVAPSSFGSITAVCTTTGIAGNVNAGTITRLDQPITGITAVTNLSQATGGQEAEPVAELEARLPALIRGQGGERVITTEDAEQRALEEAGVARAIAFGDRGALTIHILLTDLNEAIASDPVNAPNAATRAAIKADVEARTIPGVAVAVNQPTLTLVALVKVEVRLRAGYSSGAVRLAMLDAWEEYLSALPIYDADGVTLITPGWEWGESLFRNEAVALLDAVDGVSRIGDVYVRTSTDYGATWSAETLLVEVEATANGSPNALYGLLSAGVDGANPLTLVTI